MKKTMSKLKIMTAIVFALLLFGCSNVEQKIFDKALELQSKGKYEDAIKNYNEIIDKHPKSKFVSNSNVKLNQCIDLIIKQGDDMAIKKDYFKAVNYYENALKFRSSSDELMGKISKTKKMATQNTDNTKKEEKSEGQEYKIALDALNNYKGKKINNFNSQSKILQMLIDWEAAWESQNINIYKSFYDTSFVGVSSGKTMNYNQWMEYKSQLFRKYTKINIASKLVDTTLQGNELKIKFEQWFNGYGENHYSDHTYKELIFKYTQNNGWLIISEKPY